MQRGVLKRRPGKKPRPIVVSPVTNRIVQRAILETLQSDARAIKKRLGDVPSVLSTPTYVGGIRGRGSQDAVRLIRQAIDDGATHFVRSDICDFFTRVPTGDLLDHMRQETKDDEFVDLVRDGLKVELANANDPSVRLWLSLFPDGDVGVPQGSSLSAFCANYVLREFDQRLNGRGVTTVRYIDDFVILGPSESAVTSAWTTGETLLKSMRLEVHSPTPGGAKASLGKVSDGFDFLSYRFHHDHTGVAASAKSAFREAVRGVLSAGRKAIEKEANLPRRASPMYCQTLDAVDRRIRGWGDAFREADNRVEFSQLDEWASQQIDRFHAWYFKFISNKSADERRRVCGVALLKDTPPPFLLDPEDT